MAGFARLVGVRGSETTIPDRKEEATGTQYIRSITRFSSVFVVGGQSSILVTRALAIEAFESLTVSRSEAELAAKAAVPRYVIRMK